MHLRLELLLFWSLLFWLLHLILHQQPSVCRGALLRCGFVAVAFIFAAVHRAATSLPVSIISFCIFVHAGGAGRARAPARRAAPRSVSRQASDPRLAVPQAQYRVSP
jgi:hypothetical protein